LPIGAVWEDMAAVQYMQVAVEYLLMIGVVDNVYHQAKCRLEAGLGFECPLGHDKVIDYSWTYFPLFS